MRNQPEKGHFDKTKRTLSSFLADPRPLLVDTLLPDGGHSTQRLTLSAPHLSAAHLSKALNKHCCICCDNEGRGSVA